MAAFPTNPKGQPRGQWKVVVVRSSSEVTGGEYLRAIPFGDDKAAKRDKFGNLLKANTR